MKVRFTLATLREAQDNFVKPVDIYDQDTPGLLVRVGKTKLTFYAYISRLKKEKLLSMSAHDLTQGDLKSLRLRASERIAQSETKTVRYYDDSTSRDLLEDVYKKVVSKGVYETILRLGDILDIKINKLRADDLEQFKRRGMDAGLEQKTLREKYYALRGMLEYGKREGYISLHYVNGVKFQVNADDTIAKVYTAEQLDRLYEVLEHRSIRDRVIVLFTLMAGARPGETIKLKKKDIDLERGLAKAKATQTKTHALRYLEMPEPLTELLKEYLENEYVHNPEGWLFLNEKTGEPLAKYRKQWNTIKAQAKLGDMRMYDLRHTYCSKLIEHAPLHVVQKLMGHRSIKTTSKYLHHFDEDRTEAVKRVSNSLGYKG